MSAGKVASAKLSNDQEKGKNRTLNFRGQHPFLSSTNRNLKWFHRFGPHLEFFSLNLLQVKAISLCPGRRELLLCRQGSPWSRSVFMLLYSCNWIVLRLKDLASRTLTTEQENVPYSDLANLRAASSQLISPSGRVWVVTDAGGSSHKMANLLLKYAGSQMEPASRRGSRGSSVRLGRMPARAK